MHLDNQLPIRVLHILERNISQDSSIVEEDVYSSELLYCSLDNLLSVFYRVVVGDGFSSRLADLFDDEVGGL